MVSSEMAFLWKDMISKGIEAVDVGLDKCMC
jgi:hypothetical protein